MAKPEKTNARTATRPTAHQSRWCNRRTSQTARWPVALMSCTSHAALSADTTWMTGLQLNTNCERVPPPRDVAVERL